MGHIYTISPLILLYERQYAMTQYCNFLFHSQNGYTLECLKINYLFQFIYSDYIEAHTANFFNTFKIETSNYLWVMVGGRDMQPQ